MSSGGSGGRKTVLGTGYSKCKGPVVGMGLMGLRGSVLENKVIRNRMGGRASVA